MQNRLGKFQGFSLHREELKKHKMEHKMEQMKHKMEHKMEQMKKKQAAAAEYEEYDYDADYHDDADYHEYQSDDYDYGRGGEEGEDEEKEPAIRLKVPFSPHKGILDPLVPKAQIAR